MSLEEIDVDMNYHNQGYDSFPDIEKNLLFELSVVSPAKSSDEMPSPPRLSSLNILLDNMKVFLRVRPLKEAEKNDDEGCFAIDGSTVELSAPKNSKAFLHRGGKDLHSFKFNQIYDEFISQNVLFENGMLSTMKEFIDGQNSLVFAYGVTNSGKTHTMLGSHKDPGIIPRALNTVFNSIGDQQNDQSDLKPQFYCQVEKLSTSDMAIAAKHKTMILNTASKAIDSSDLHSSWDSLASKSSIGESLIDGFDGESGISFSSGENLKFSIWVSFAEIYNEQIYDLLEPPSKLKQKTMTLREDKNGNPYIKVSSAEEAVKVLTFGQRSLQYVCTKLNESSSRSHCIFNVKIVRVADMPDPCRVQMSQLSFCDLAGSERYTQMRSEGKRLKEAGNINTSLLTLGRCIQLLRENQLGKTAKVVPFRESKLTRLFQTFFSGKGRACMFVNICPAASCFDENLQVLKFSAIARRLKVVADKAASLVLSKAKTDVLLVLEQSTNDCREAIRWKETEELEVTEEQEEASVEQYKEWLATLKQALIDTNELLKEERRASTLLESRLRTEIAQEMMQHFTEVECSDQEQLVATRQRMKDAMKPRVHIINSAIEKSAPDNSKTEGDLKPIQIKLEHTNDELDAAKKELELMQKVTKCDPIDVQKDRYKVPPGIGRKPRLKSDAIPTIFTAYPTYLQPKAVKRRTPTIRTESLPKLGRTFQAIPDPENTTPGDTTIHDGEQPAASDNQDMPTTSCRRGGRPKKHAVTPSAARMEWLEALLAVA
ncbi:kinesin-like protein KIF20A [Watersipora subatra]|uniref:kinesin-like protein KIF20A n=1 Tax=Watersipora subatra TaxID=2589382 RepID=UPI00355C0B2A